MLLKKEYEVKSLQTLGYVAKLKQHIRTPRQYCASVDLLAVSFIFNGYNIYYFKINIASTKDTTFLSHFMTADKWRVFTMYFIYILK